MDFRIVITAAGDEFNVPEYILRRDEEGFAGWQLRYGEWTDYPDLPGDREGAAKALQRAMDVMQFRIDTLGK